MITELTKLGLIVMLTASIAWATEVNWQARRAALGHQEKFRIMVDKVLAKDSTGHLGKMTGKRMDEIRDAGFNVLSPRAGGHDLEWVRRDAEMAQERGMFYMSWISIGNLTRKGQTATKNMLGSNGKTALVLSPNANEFWDIVTDLIVGQARISVEVPSVIGAFFDFEGYAMAGIPGHYYPLSYDDVILNRFARAKGIKLPKLADAERYPWLKKKDLHDAFREFQLNYWRQRCRKLREQVDAINPAFQFIVYPIPGTLFTIEAFMPELGTRQAPLILAHHRTYGRGTGVGQGLAHEDGLRSNRNSLLKGMRMLPNLSTLPHFFVGGIDPISAGADPEFCGKNAVLISDLTNGYWVFYEGPDYKTTHRDYFKWFKRANQAIEARRFAFWRQPRKDPDPNTLLADPNIKAKLNRFETDKPKLGYLGPPKELLEDIKSHGFEAHQLESLSLPNLQRYDVVVLQHLSVDLASDDPTVEGIRAYVARGGGLMLTDRRGVYVDAWFPEIAKRSYPPHADQYQAQVNSNKYVVVRAHKALGPVSPGTHYVGGAYWGHKALAPGPKGTVLIENEYGDAATIAGTWGQGRVVVSGCYYGHDNRLIGVEKPVFLSILDWLAGTGEK